MTILQLLNKVNSSGKDGELPDGWEDAFEELMGLVPFDIINDLQDKVNELEGQVHKFKKHNHVDNKVYVPIDF